MIDGDGVGGAFAAEKPKSVKMTIEQMKQAQAAELARVQQKHAEELERLQMLERAENLRLAAEAAANAKPIEVTAAVATMAPTLVPVMTQSTAQEQRTSALAEKRLLAKKPTEPPAEVAKKWSQELKVLELAFNDTLQSRMTEQHAAVELAEALDRCSDCQSTALLVAHEVEALKKEQASSEEVMLELKAKEEAATIVELAAVRRVHEGTTSAVPEHAQSAADRKAEAARAMAAAKAREEECLHLYEEATIRAGREQQRLMAAEQEVADAESSMRQVREELCASEACLARQQEVEAEAWLEMEGLKLEHWEIYAEQHQQRLASQEMRAAKETGMQAVVASHQKRISVCQSQIRDREAQLPALTPEAEAGALMTTEEQAMVVKEKEEKDEIAALREQLRKEREQQAAEEAAKEAALRAAEEKRREEKAIVQAQLRDPFHITSFVHRRAVPPPRVRQQALPCPLSAQKPVLKPHPKPSSYVMTTRNQPPPRRRRRISAPSQVSPPTPVSISTQTEFFWIDETAELIQWGLEGMAADDDEEDEAMWHDAPSVVFVDETQELPEPAPARQDVGPSPTTVESPEQNTPIPTTEVEGNKQCAPTVEGEKQEIAAEAEESIRSAPTAEGEKQEITAEVPTEMSQSPFVATLRESLLQQAYEETRLALALAEADLAEEEKATSLHEVRGTDTSDLLVEEAAEEKGKAGVVTTTPSKSPERPAVVGPIEPAPAEETTPNEATVPAAVQDRAPGSGFDMSAVQARLRFVRDKSEGSVPRNASPVPPARAPDVAEALMQDAPPRIDIALEGSKERELPWAFAAKSEAPPTTNEPAAPVVAPIMAASSRPSVAERLATLRKQSIDEKETKATATDANSEGRSSLTERIEALRKQPRPNKLEEKLGPVGLRSPALAKIGQQFASMVAEGLEMPPQPQHSECPTSPTAA